MMPSAPAATPAPIHDITGPWALTEIPLPFMIGGAVALLLLALLAVWYFGARGRKRPLSPRERARRELDALRSSMATPYEIGVRASDALRTFIHEEFGLDAVHRTSIEFLESLRDNAVFDANQKSALAAFLESADLMKYARADAGREEIGMLLDTAGRLVAVEPPKEPAKR